MKKGLSPGSPPTDQGAALVLVLCFVFLLTVLTVAYFSRTMVSRQLSNASTAAGQASTIANSAADIIVGDLKQEIANGATMTLAGNNPTYVPKQASNAVPQRNAAPAVTATGGVIPNLVRRSASKDAVVGDPTDYVSAPALTSRASAVNSTVPSLNGRYVSPARWNRHYLVPTDPAAPTPSAKPVSSFPAPDWVFVTAEKGPSVLSAPRKDAGGNSITVTGRYAYTIYDEGGLLDINHTGYPSTSLPEHIGAKPAPSYADLTQLPPRSTSTAKLTAANVDNLLAWRQYATLQASGVFPNNLQPSNSQSAEAAYYGLFTSNPRSLLQVPLAVWNGKTDQAFLSRQQLIDFFTTAKLDPWYLQYLGTFNRGLNQPSYAPETSPKRPTVLDPSSGGNNSSGNDGITPSFLTTVVLKNFARPTNVTPTRNALANEPLVKQRFPLNRLAWLTYQGPSQARNLSDPDMAALISNYGITADFLAQGTSDNIRYYFGLEWDGSYWKYVHGTNGVSGAILNINNSAKPIDVVRLTGSNAREPDFFELLKASINPGSIAKTSLSPAVLRDNPKGELDSAQAQYQTDASLDAAIMQIGANIIDQFDTDGFPTQIQFDLTSSGKYASVYGDENLPYISQVRSGLIRLVSADPSEVGTATADPVKNTGLAVLMNYPEVWNPHDWSSASSDLIKQSFGQVAPTKFKIYAETPAYNGIQRGNSVYLWNTNAHDSCDADPALSPGFTTKYGFSFGNNGSHAGGELRTLSELKTEMTFTVSNDITGGPLFREPTILYRPGGAYQLASTALVYTNGLLGQLAATSNKAFFAPASSGGGLYSIVSAPNPDQSNSLVPASGSAYVGFYLGAHPLRWWDTDVPDAQPGQPPAPKNVPAYQTQYGPINDIKYTLACDDGNGGWIYYDSKSITSVGGPNTALNTGPDAGFGINGTTGTGADRCDLGLRYFTVVDPRTSRFGMVDPWIPANDFSIPPRGGYSYANAVDGTTKGMREDVSSGTAWFYTVYAYSSFFQPTDWYSSAMGWYHGNDSGSTNANWLRPGLLTQNDPHWTPDGNIATTALPDGSSDAGPFPPFLLRGRGRRGAPCVRWRGEAGGFQLEGRSADGLYQGDAERRLFQRWRGATPDG